VYLFWFYLKLAELRRPVLSSSLRINKCYAIGPNCVFFRFGDLFFFTLWPGLFQSQCSDYDFHIFYFILFCYWKVALATVLFSVALHSRFCVLLWKKACHTDYHQLPSLFSRLFHFHATAEWFWSFLFYSVLQSVKCWGWIEMPVYTTIQPAD